MRVASSSGTCKQADCAFCTSSTECLLTLSTYCSLRLVANVHIVATAENIAEEGSASLIVQQRPRALGRRLVIPLDATVAFVECSGRSPVQNTIKLLYGMRGKRLYLRLSSALERQRWMEAIAAAVGTSVHAMIIHPGAQSRLDTPSKTSRDTHSKPFQPQPVRMAQPALLPIRHSAANMPANWPLREYYMYETYIIAAAPHPTQLDRCNQQLQVLAKRSLPDSRYTNTRGITFEPNCC